MFFRGVTQKHQPYNDLGLETCYCQSQDLPLKCKKSQLRTPLFKCPIQKMETKA